jgi:hypothetical protein
MGATMTPFKGSTVFTAAREQTRQQTNAWILTSGAFDATVDPDDPQALRPEFDSGDHLHLTDAGYAAMGQSVDVRGLLRLTRVDADSASTAVGGTAGATLALSLGGPGSFGSFVPGAARGHTALSIATVTSTAGTATLRSGPGR